MAAMDDSFRTRVEKIFGSLKSSLSSSLHQQPPSWSLSDAEVERKEWRRESGSTDRDELLCSSSYGELLREGRRTRGATNSRKELDDEEDDDGDFDHRRSQDDFDEWDIRTSIGLDRTLDNEEEEDTFDKVASGREYDGERLYMGDVTERGCSLNSHNVLESALPCATKKDPRANHMAARIRLKEDDAEANDLNPHKDCWLEIKNPFMKASDDRGQPRSILKRKSDDAGPKTQKRVRFDPLCIEEALERPAEFDGSKDSDDTYRLAEEAPWVPDYLLNPSRYTRYTFDSSDDVDEESNKKACFDFLKLVQSPTGVNSMKVDDVPCVLPKSVTFVAKKKACDVQGRHNNNEVNQMEDGNKLPTGVSMGIAAGEARKSKDDSEDNDDPDPSAEVTTTAFQKSGRTYRKKCSFDSES